MSIKARATRGVPLPAGSESRRSIPVVFGTEHDLFGVLSPPLGGQLRTGVVICAPLGHQNICTYRPLRVLAHRLSERGMAVLRFDWWGCGDSADPSRPVEGPEHWRNAVRQAIELLQTSTGVEEIALVGLRIGATFGLLEALQNELVTQAVLLAPYATGRAYLRELRAFEALARQSAMAEPALPVPPLPGGSMEAGGFLITASEVEALEAVDLGTSPPEPAVPRRVLIVSAQEDRVAARLSERLSGAGSEVTSRLLPELVQVWNSSQVSFMPPTCSELIADWLLENGAAADPGRISIALPPAVLSLDDGAIVEHATVLDRGAGGVFAVTCSPGSATAAGDDWIVFLNTGRIRRAGTNRLSTLWARRWGQMGIRSLRLDVQGVGDSERDSMGDEAYLNKPALAYRPHVLNDIVSALDWLAEERRAKRFVLVGLCSGATTAYQVALADSRVTAVGMVNPPAFFWDDRLKLLREERSLKSVYGSIRGSGAAGGSKVIRAGLSRLVSEPPESWHRREILESLARLKERRTGVALVYSDRDRGLRYLSQALGPEFRSQVENLGVAFDIVQGPDHTFRPLWSHPILEHRLDDLLRSTGVLGESPSRSAADMSVERC